MKVTILLFIFYNLLIMDIFLDDFFFFCILLFIFNNLLKFNDVKQTLITFLLLNK